MAVSMRRERWAWILIAAAALLLAVGIVEFVRTESTDERDQADLVGALLKGKY
jgi:hypothetical protein